MTPETRRQTEAINAKLPAWTHSLSNRTKWRVLSEHEDGNLREVTPKAVRALGRQHWMRVPNLGMRSVGELFDLVARLDRLPMWPARRRP